MELQLIVCLPVGSLNNMLISFFIVLSKKTLQKQSTDPVFVKQNVYNTSACKPNIFTLNGQLR